jgi:hypothetical protein
MSLTYLEFYEAIFPNLTTVRHVDKDFDGGAGIEYDMRETIHLRAFNRDNHAITNEWFKTPEEAMNAVAWFESQGVFDIYFGVNARQQYNTMKGGVTQIHLLHADMDWKHFPDGKEEAMNVLLGFELAPSVVVNSGGGYHLYWVLDTPLEPTPANVACVEALMERLYYRLGGLDKVQDISRIFRCPGTTNHKYETKPVATIEESLSDASRRYALADFEAVLPLLPTTRTPTLATGDCNDWTEEDIASMLAVLPPQGWDYRDYLGILMGVHSVLPDERGVRLIQEWSPVLDRNGDDITAAKFASFRSSGYTIGTVIHHALDNGWVPPQRGPKILLTRERARRSTGDSVSATTAQPAHSLGILLSEVQPETVEWLWPGRIPYGKLTVVDGDPGTGKSVMTLDLAARLTTGRPMPDGTPVEVAGVVIVNPEDGIADTLVPRLNAACGDASRVSVLDEVLDDKGYVRSLRLPGDIPTIEAEVTARGARLVIFDSLMGALGERVDSYRDQDMRAALSPLAGMAHRTGAAIVLIRHLNKGTGGKALYRGGGSIGIVGVARSGLLVAKDPHDESRRILASSKSNLAPPPKALAYRLADTPNGSVRVEWLGEADYTADELVTPASAEERSAVDAAKEWLAEFLADGDVPATRVLAEGQQRGHSDKALYAAYKALGGVPQRRGFGRGGFWLWHLPPAPIVDRLAA